MTAILAQTVSAEVDTADIFFLFGVVLLVIAALLAAMAAMSPPRPEGRWCTTVGYLGLACLAVGLWVL
jgi:hypothetical protein